MGPIEATISVPSNHAELSGRASRAEYWWFVAAWTVAYLAVLWMRRNKSKLPELALIAVTLVLVMSVSFRRLEDAGFSGWWAGAELVVFCALALIMMLRLPSNEDADADPPATLDSSAVASFVMVFVAATGTIRHFSLPSEPGQNEYGPNPYEVLK